MLKKCDLKILIEGSPATPLAALFPQLPHDDTLGVLIDAEPATFQASQATQQQMQQFRQRGSFILG